MADKKRTLVLCVDRDDDLGSKAKIRGPVIGRERNVNAATKLALIDPQETDANTIFEAIKTYDEFSKKTDAHIATLTGSPRLGYAADVTVAKQLERVLADFPAESCIFVSDGASDEQVLPIVQSRVKIDSVRTVVMKQTKELEKTYFVILEKLKEPQYARLVFGLPGAALLFMFIAGDFGLRAFVGLLGLYLIFKGFGIEEALFNTLASFRLSAERASSILYLTFVPLFLVSLWLGISQVSNQLQLGTDNPVKLAAWFLRDTLLLLPLALLMLMLGRVLDAHYEKREYKMSKYGVYAVAIVVLWFIFGAASSWVIGDAYFSEFVASLFVGIVVMYAAIMLMRRYRMSVISRMKLEGKTALTEIGSQIGRIVGINKRKDVFIVQTASGQRLDFGFDHIADVGEKVVIRY